MFKVHDQEPDCQQVNVHFGLIEQRKFHLFDCHEKDTYIHLTPDNYKNADIFPRKIQIASDRDKFD
jgi:hypothetical protein